MHVPHKTGHVARISLAMLLSSTIQSGRRAASHRSLSRWPLQTSVAVEVDDDVVVCVCVVVVVAVVVVVVELVVDGTQLPQRTGQAARTPSPTSLFTTKHTGNSEGRHLGKSVFPLHTAVRVDVDVDVMDDEVVLVHVPQSAGHAARNTLETVPSASEQMNCLSRVQAAASKRLLQESRGHVPQSIGHACAPISTATTTSHVAL